MDILPLEDGGVCFLEMPGAFYDQLIVLADTCDPAGDPAITSRLFPHPIDEEEGQSIREAVEEDWGAFVWPEQEAAFDRALRTVMEDLDRAIPSGDSQQRSYRLEIPDDHVPPWFQVLNRARIVLALKYRLPFTDYPSEAEKVSLQRLFAAHLSEHYADILEILLQQMSGNLS